MVKEMLARLPAAPSGVFVCGSDPFVDNAVAALEGLGVSNVKTESYGE
jgi:ferredoxin-NADP reductase